MFHEFMLAIKLSRFGKKKLPTYRVVVLEKTKDPWGDYLEKLGHYNPRDKKIELNAERVKYWISKGAQPSDTVYNLFVSQGLIEGKKKTATNISKKRKLKLDEKNKAKALKEKVAVETPAEEPKVEVKTEEPAVETPAEEPKVEVKTEEPVAETPAEETK